MANKPSSCSSHCQPALPELKLYQAFIFSIPILFTLVLLLLFYMLYLRRRRTAWTASQLRDQYQARGFISVPSERGLKKEFRDMLPVIIYNENFLGEDTICSVCLGDYQTDEKLQQLPFCGHTFHLDCIDNWLINNATCPLCRTSLLQAAKVVPLDSPAHIAMSQQTHGVNELIPVSFSQQVHPIEDLPAPESIGVLDLQREEHSRSNYETSLERTNTNSLDIHEVQISVTGPQEGHSIENTDFVICIESNEM